MTHHAPVSRKNADTDLGTLVFYSEFDEPEPWRDALLAQLPDLDFRVHPDIGDPSSVQYVLAWKPKSGFFQEFSNLRLVVNLGAGVDSLTGRDDLPDVPICRLSDPGMVALMRSYVAFAVIRYARDMPDFEAAQRKGEWRYIHPTPLHLTRVAVLGLGSLGSAVAKGLADLGFDVRGWDRDEKDVPGVIVMQDRTEMLAGADIVVNMMPLTSETRRMVDARMLAEMKPGVKFVNASRGQVVDEPALVAALQSGHVAAATLDAFETEPLPAEHPFWTMDNVYITPHLASITVPEKAAGDVAESIRRVRRGESPLHLIDPKRGY